MGTSFTEFREHGFWAHETPLEIWLRLVSLHLRYQMGIEYAAFVELRETWLYATSGCQGCVGNFAALDRVLSNDILLRIAAQAADDTLKAIQRLGPKLDHRYLNALGLPVVFDAELEAWMVVQIGEYFIRLLRGELQLDLHSSPVLPVKEV